MEKRLVLLPAVSSVPKARAEADQPDSVADGAASFEQQSALRAALRQVLQHDMSGILQSSRYSSPAPRALRATCFGRRHTTWMFSSSQALPRCQPSSSIGRCYPECSLAVEPQSHCD